MSSFGGYHGMLYMVNVKYTSSMHCEFIREVCGDKVCLIALKQLDLENE